MSASNVRKEHFECIIEINRRKIAITAVVIDTINCCGLVLGIYFILFSDRLNRWFIVIYVIFICVILFFNIRQQIRTLRNPPPPIELDRQGIIFPALPDEILLPAKKMLWDKVFYMYFQAGGHGVPHQLNILLKGKDLYTFSSWGMYCSRRQLMDLMEEYAGRRLFIGRKLYFFGPSEAEIQRFRDEQRKAGKRLRNKRQF